MKSKAYRAAEAEAVKRDAQLKATDFGSTWVRIVTDDGSEFLIRDAFYQKWHNPEDEEGWVLVFCEHYPTMVFAMEDLEYIFTFHKDPND